MGDGYSTDIEIRRGTPQGDRASSFIFIIAIEILNSASVFKLPSALVCCFGELLSPYPFSLDVRTLYSSLMGI
jgi:hypothetical protein